MDERGVVSVEPSLALTGAGMSTGHQHLVRPTPGYPKLVRCLGPGEREHEFKSRSPSERVCPRCRRRQDGMSFCEMIVLTFDDMSQIATEAH